VVDVVARTDAATSDHMTWDVTDLGFKMGLSPAVPDVLARHAKPVVEQLLERHGLTVADVHGWAVHPGGRKIVEVVGEVLELPERLLAPSYDVLRDVGNCSSATVLLVLERLAETGRRAPRRDGRRDGLRAGSDPLRGPAPPARPDRPQHPGAALSRG
jgi:predicted naringenin-chalcone synthase